MTVLIVEDEPLIAMDLEAVLEDNGHTVIIATDTNSAKKMIDEHNFEWAFMDYNLQDGSILPVADALLETETKLCFISGADISKDTLEKYNAVFFAKPFDLDLILKHVVK